MPQMSNWIGDHCTALAPELAGELAALVASIRDDRADRRPKRRQAGQQPGGRDSIRRRRISLFSSSSADLLRRPAEARAVAPQAMQDDRQLAGERELRMPHAFNVDQPPAITHVALTVQTAGCSATCWLLELMQQCRPTKPCATSHSRAVLSDEAVASVCPSGLKATDNTSSSWSPSGDKNGACMSDLAERSAGGACGLPGQACLTPPAADRAPSL
jgi:hypothetical protein